MPAARMRLLAILSSVATVAAHMIRSPPTVATILSSVANNEVAAHANNASDVGMYSPLNEEGYQEVASLKSDADMELFVTRLLDAKSLISTNQGDLKGFVKWYSGTKSVQTFEKLCKELPLKAWVSSEAMEKIAGNIRGAALGLHRVVFQWGVPVSTGPERRSTRVALLEDGSEVDVVEIGEVFDNRLRVRIAEPVGWISLKQVELGIDYLVPVVGNCQKFCSRHMSLWTTKCAWKGGFCNDCAECMSDEAKAKVMLGERQEVEIAAQDTSEEAAIVYGCNWNCYVKRYPQLKNEEWEAEKGNMDYARSHYIKFGKVAGKNCKCEGSKSFLKVEDTAKLAAETEIGFKEIAEVEETIADEQAIAGCNWSCYLDRYPHLRNVKWEALKGNLDYARNHYISFGRAAGKNCKCEDQKTTAAAAS